MTTPQNPPSAASGTAPFTTREHLCRLAAAGHGVASAMDCEKTIQVGIFFDGTNNNRDRDKAESPPSHTNIVTLYETFKDKPEEGCFAYYVPGVGTRFMEVGEPTESDDGKAYGKGGDQRINWALIQVVNSIHYAAYKEPLLRAYDAGVEAGQWPLHSEGRIDAARGDKRKYFVDGLHSADDHSLYQRRKVAYIADARTECENRRSQLKRRKARLQQKGELTPAQAEAIDREMAELDLRVASLDKTARTRTLRPLLTRLSEALAQRPLPKVRLVNVSVFGFSRGAAQARAFCNFLQDILTPDASGTIEKIRGKDAPGFALAGIALRVQFLGLFDTVASAGLADASPFWRGFGGWANGTQDIPACVERTVHYVAGHELRLAFPSSSTRLGRAQYPKNCLEVVYPGVHSDVGGGYDPGCQGKARGGRRELLSQVPLVHMYREARVWGVALQSESELRNDSQGANALQDMQIAPETAKLYDTYLAHSAVKLGPSEDMMKAHTQVYWRWREQVSADASFAALDSVRNASPQHKQDLLESEKDYRLDRERIQQASEARDGRESPKLPGPVERDYREAMARPPVSKEVHAFFDRLVHDSHATFYMLGPTTALDRQNLYEALVEKKEQGQSLTPLEQRIVDGRGQFPVLTDAESIELRKMIPEAYKSGAMWATRQRTRRETGGHIHYRKVFDAS